MPLAAADQLRALFVPGLLKVATQLQPCPGEKAQSVFALKLAGFTVRVGGGAGVHVHDTERDCGWAAPAAVKVKVPS
jgi:hypothetical protein